MTDVYQRIYDADVIEGNGLRAFIGKSFEQKDFNGEKVVVVQAFEGSKPVDLSAESRSGYVVVDESDERSKATDVLIKVVIPEEKLKSYDLAERLFDNYELNSKLPEDDTEEELAEVDELLDYILNRGPMKLARTYIEEESGKAMSDEQWYALVKRTWFRTFRVGGSPSRNGFEHVFLGERSGSKVGGLHWWYYYWSKKDYIDSLEAIYDNEVFGRSIPELVTLSFTWTVNRKRLTKKIGGFFVGLSVEGLMAMGMVRAYPTAPTMAVIEGARIDLKMFFDDRVERGSVNTFYPVFLGLEVEPEPSRPGPGPQVTSPGVRPTSRGDRGDVRLMAALVNPEGPDSGKEQITLVNVGSASVSMKGWKVRGPNNSVVVLGDLRLRPNEPVNIRIPARGSLQLSNRGGTVVVLTPTGVISHEIEYSGFDAGIQGQLLIWDGKDKLVRPGTA